MANTNINFKVEERNTYSLAALVKSNVTTSMAQFIQLQTLCYYYDIAICCSESRAKTCDLLTELNNMALEGKLPARTYRRGRAYLNAKGIMVFSNNERKPLPYKELIGDPTGLSRDQIKYINNVLLKNWQKKGLTVEEKAERLVPASFTIETLTKEMMENVRKYRMTFDLNRTLPELFTAYEKFNLALEAQRLSYRTEYGESYIENSVIVFRALEPKEDTCEKSDAEIKKEKKAAKVTKEKKEKEQKKAAQSTKDKKAIKTPKEEQAVQETKVEDVVQGTKEVIKDVAHAASFYITSKPKKDKTARVIYIQEDNMVNTLETKYRASITECTCLAIKDIVDQGYTNVTVYIDDKAKDLITQPDGFTTELEKLTHDLAQDNKLELKLVDKKSQAYLDFVERCI